MEETTSLQLENSRNYSTLYEVVLTNGTDSRLIGYGRKNRRGLIAAVQRKGDEILRVVDISPEDFNGAITPHSMDLSGGWIAKFSGRTQRQAIIEGELIGL